MRHAAYQQILRGSPVRVHAIAVRGFGHQQIDGEGGPVQGGHGALGINAVITGKHDIAGGRAKIDHRGSEDVGGRQVDHVDIADLNVVAMVHGPKHLDHALNLPLAIEGHLAFAIHQLECIALQDRHEFLGGWRQVNRHLRIGFVNHRQRPGVIAMGMGYDDGVEALSRQLIEIGQRIARFEPDAAINQDRGIGHLEERTRSANGTGAAEKAQLNLCCRGHVRSLMEIDVSGVCSRCRLWRVRSETCRNRVLKHGRQRGKSPGRSDVCEW